jgi:bacteriocin-like protein
MANEEKVAKIKELIAEIDELSKELSEDELKQVAGGLPFDLSDTIIY